MFRRILVPLDGSVVAESALASAALLAKRCESEVLLVGCARGHAFPGFLTSAARRQTYKLERYLSLAAVLLSAEGVNVETAVLSERPAAGIARQSQARGVDLIVMATYKRGGQETLLHPSLIWSVLTASSAPMLVLKPPDTEHQEPNQPRLPRFLAEPAVPIIVPLDGSRRSERALPLAQKLAWLFAHPLLLVRAAALPYLAGGVVDYPMTLDELRKWSLEETWDYLEHKRAELAQTGLVVKIESMSGEAATCIEACVQDYNAGLVVMASHSRSGLSRLLLGSTSRSVLSRVAVPLLVVPTARLADAARARG